MRAARPCGLLVVLLSALGLLTCSHQAPPPPPAPATPRVLDPWRWHFVGGLLVVEGELDQPMELTLRGRSMLEARSLPLGPVRWEMYRPPPGEVAELRTRDGKLLARWDFDAPPAPVPKPESPPKLIAKLEPPPAPRPEPPPVPKPAPLAPKSEPPAPKPAPPAPKPVPPAPKPVPPPPKPVPPVPKPVPPLPKPVPPVPKPVPPPPKPAPPAPKPVPPAPKPVPPPPKPVPPAPKPQPPAPKPEPPPPPPAAQSAQGWPGAGQGLNLLRGPKGDRRICMTFDGGSSAEVAVEVLDALKVRGIRTTLFLTGDFIRKYPDLVRRMARDGHELGNHTLTHPHLAPNYKRDPRWTRERVQQELLEADRALFRLLGRPMDPLWRAPFGEHTQEIRQWAEELGYRHVGWSEGADTLDWATLKERRLYRTGNAILDRLHARMDKRDGDGLIVLMHLGSGRPEGDRPAKVLGPFLDRALQEGWHFVTIGEYLQGLGRPPWDSARRIALLRIPGA